MSATRELRDLAELLRRERAARSALEDDKRIRARLFATMAEQLLTHANAIDGWTDPPGGRIVVASIGT